MAVYDALREQLLGYSFLGNTGWDYAVAAAVFAASFLVLYFFKIVVLVRLKRLSRKTKTEWDDMLLSLLDVFHWQFFLLLSLMFGLHYLNLPWLDKFLRIAVLVFVTYYAVKSIGAVIKFFEKRIIEKEQRDENPVDPAVVHLLGGILKAVVAVIALLALLSNLGFNITSLIAGLGIGGIAIAFALQNVLSDIFASFSIYFDKPFRVGDTIMVGTQTGTVEKVGIKTTRIRTLQGEELIVSNRELTTVPVSNFRRMEQRRIVFRVGVTYDTPIAKVEKIQKMLWDIIEKEEHTEPDRVSLIALGPYSLDFEVAYFVKVPDYKEYAKAQHNINIAIMKTFEREKIAFAFPTQTIHLGK